MTDLIKLPTGLTLAEYEHLGDRLGKALAPNSVRAYRARWESWRQWASNRGVSICPARPEQVAAFLDQLADTHSFNTVSLTKTTIAKMHELANCPNPCDSLIVRHVYKAIRRDSGRPKQAKPLTKRELKKMQGVMNERDMALIRVMRDGLLRVSEVAALRWNDIQDRERGAGTMHIRRSKTDQRGMGHYGYLAPVTMQALSAIKRNRRHGRVFPVHPDHIGRRIRTLAIRADLGQGYSGHSPRVGMAVDLVEMGIQMPALMQVGRWRSAGMPTRYTEQVAAAWNAVAQYYGETPGQEDDRLDSDELG